MSTLAKTCYGFFATGLCAGAIVPLIWSSHSTLASLAAIGAGFFWWTSANLYDKAEKG